MICREIVHFHFGFSFFLLQLVHLLSFSMRFFLLLLLIFSIFACTTCECNSFFSSCFLLFSANVNGNVFVCMRVVVCGYPFFSWNIQIQLNSQLTINYNILVWVSECETFVYFIVFDKIRRIRKIGKEKVFQLIHHLLATLTNIPWHPLIPGIFERYMANWAYSSKRRIQNEWNIVRTPIGMISEKG